MFEKLIEFAVMLWGSESIIINVLLTIMAIDYITGVCAAIYLQKLSSSIGSKGIMQKVGIVCLVILSHMIGKYLINDNNVLRNATAMFYMSNEIISIFENANRLGLPLPKKLQSIFSSINDSTKN